MARPLRIQYPGAWYHLTARGLERRRLFADDRDRQHLLELLAGMVERYAVALHGFVLMDNHYHLLVSLQEPNLSAAMQWLGNSYAMWFNRRQQRVGPLYQGRFKAIVVDAEAYAAEVSRYVHLNPVRVKREGLDKAAQAAQRAGVLPRAPDAQELAGRLARLRAYRWSSYRAYIGLTPAPDWLTVAVVRGMLGGGKAVAQRRAYQRFVEEPLRLGLPESPWERLVGGVVLGSKEFVRQTQRWARGDAREQPALKALQARPGWEAVVALVAAVKRERWEEFRDRHGDWGRELAWYVARRHCGLALRELGARAGGVPYAAVGQAIKRFGRRVQTDRRLQEVLQRVEADLLKVET